MSRLLIILVPVLALVASAPAQERKKRDKDKKDPPKVLYAVPLVIKPGEKQKLALRGRGLDEVTEVKVAGADGAAVKLLGKKKAAPGNNQSADKVGDSEAEVELELPKGAKPGEVKLTAVNPNGESPAYAPLLRDDTPAVTEKEPNDGFDAAQAVTLPAAVEGTVKNDKDVDVYKFEGKKGDRVAVEVQAARWGSPLDALVGVYDADRRTLAQADDADGSADPKLTVTLPRDGVFYVTVIDAHDAGGPAFGYRLVVRSGGK